MLLRSSKSCLLSLALLLVFAQGALAYHEADLGQHAPNDVCEWCVGGVPFHGGLPTHAGVAAAVTAHALQGAADHAPLCRFSSRVYRSRAPPVSLS